MAKNDEFAVNGSEDPSLGEKISLLEQTVAAYRQELAELRDKVERVAGREGTIPVASDTEEPGSAGWRRTRSRRSLLGGAGASLAALAAAGVATGSHPRRAEATDGNPILAGANNTTNGTGIWSQSGPNANLTLLRVDGSNGTIAFSSNAPLAVVGRQNGHALVGYGSSVSGVGVVGRSNLGVGVLGASDSGLDVSCTGTGRLYILPQAAPGPATTGLHSRGETIIDSRGDAYVCQATGTPGAWNAVGNLRTFRKATRVYTNLAGSANTTYGPISALANNSGVPAGAAAAYCSVQSYQTGVMTLFPEGSPDPGVANWSGSGTSGALNLLYMMVPLSAAGNFKIRTYFNGSIYVDVWGYVL
jgi:hypothetical protein